MIAITDKKQILEQIDAKIVKGIQTTYNTSCVNYSEIKEYNNQYGYRLGSDTRNPEQFLNEEELTLFTLQEWPEGWVEVSGLQLG